MRRWTKPLILLVTFSSVVLALGQPCRGINTTFTPGITAVCVLRAKRASNPESLVVQLHSADSPTDYVSVVTVNAAIRLHAYFRWQNSLDPDPQVIDKLISLPTLQLEVHAFGPDPDFASVVSLQMRQGDRTIKPVSLRNPPAVRNEKGGYTKIIVAEFPYGKFDPNAWTHITFSRNGKNINYDVDFGGFD